jgi:hypothetical protein
VGLLISRLARSRAKDDLPELAEVVLCALFLCFLSSERWVDLEGCSGGRRGVSREGLSLRKLLLELEAERKLVWS